MQIHAYDSNGNEVHANNGLDFDVYTSAADELIGGMKIKVNTVLSPLLSRAIGLENRRNNEVDIQKLCDNFGYDLNEEPIALAKWKYCFEMIFDHAMVWNKDMYCMEPVTIKEALLWRYNLENSKPKDLRDDDVVEKALNRANELNAYFNSVEPYMGIPAQYSWDVKGLKDDETVTIPGFYEVMVEIAEQGIKFWSRYNNDASLEKVAKLKRVLEESLG